LSCSDLASRLFSRRLGSGRLACLPASLLQFCVFHLLSSFMLLTLSSSIELVFLLHSGPSCNTSTTQPTMLAGAADPILELSSPIAFASVLLRFFSASRLRQNQPHHKSHPFRSLSSSTVKLFPCTLLRLFTARIYDATNNIARCDRMSRVHMQKTIRDQINHWWDKGNSGCKLKAENLAAKKLPKHGHKRTKHSQLMQGSSLGCTSGNCSGLLDRVLLRRYLDPGNY